MPYVDPLDCLVTRDAFTTKGLAEFANGCNFPRKTDGAIYFNDLTSTSLSLST